MKIRVIITRQENANYFGKQINDIVEVEFEEYVAAVVASEIGNSNLEACKAQAVAARTFAIARNVLQGEAISDSSSVAQAYRAIRYDRKKYPNAILGTELTAEEVLCYNGKAISAVFSANNGGHTVSARERWGSSKPYLLSFDDPWDAATKQKKQGHGVGLSQAGACWAGAHGASYIEILNFYYPNTKIYNNYGNVTRLIQKAETIVIAKETLEQIQIALKSIQDVLNQTV